ncbi:MAG TPA: hypothetical protein VH639_15885 [Bryobacteraceae bacterium]
MALDPRDKEALEKIGEADSHLTFPLTHAKIQAGLHPEENGPLKPAQVRGTLSRTYLPIIEDGIQSLTLALQLDASYGDAMSYLGLLLRDRALLQDSPEASAADGRLADEWNLKAIAIEKDAKSGLR